MELLKIHNELQDEFQILKVSHEEIGNIFEKFSERFLVYCNIGASYLEINNLLRVPDVRSVSYTHLTLPTICSV